MGKEMSLMEFEENCGVNQKLLESFQFQSKIRVLEQVHEV
jgi:hypothetical protein